MSNERPPRPGRLPQGRHGLPRAAVIENQRARIFDSLANASAAKGYVAVTVQEILTGAGVSRRTFYDLFTSKEHCFLTAFDSIAVRVFTEVDAAYRASGGPWSSRLADALQALTELYAAEPGMARLAMVDVLAAGPEALRRRDETLRRFAIFLEDGKSQLPAAVRDPDLLARGVLGGLYEALYAHLRDGQAERLAELMPDLAYCALMPYLGPRRSAHAIADWERGR